MELITVAQIGAKEVNSVSLRDLWKELESKKDFSDWAKKNVEIFDEGIDYTLLHQKVEQISGAKTRIEYIVTLDVAKHIAMLQRTDKGREIRQYFIEAEKPKELSRVELAQMVIEQEAEKERLKLETVEAQTKYTKIQQFAREELAPSLISISITEFARTWIKRSELSAQKINACFYALKIYDGRYRKKAKMKLNSHIPSTDYSLYFKPDIEKRKGKAIWYEIEIYQQYADELALKLKDLSEDDIESYYRIWK